MCYAIPPFGSSTLLSSSISLVATISSCLMNIILKTKAKGIARPPGLEYPRRPSSTEDATPYLAELRDSLVHGTTVCINAMIKQQILKFTSGVDCVQVLNASECEGNENELLAERGDPAFPTNSKKIREKVLRHCQDDNNIKEAIYKGVTVQGRRINHYTSSLAIEPEDKRRLLEPFLDSQTMNNMAAETDIGLYNPKDKEWSRNAELGSFSRSLSEICRHNNLTHSYICKRTGYVDLDLLNVYLPTMTERFLFETVLINPSHRFGLAIVIQEEPNVDYETYDFLNDLTFWENIVIYIKAYTGHSGENLRSALRCNPEFFPWSMMEFALHMSNQYGFEQDDIHPLHCTSIAAGRRIAVEGLVPGGRRWGNNRLAVHFSVKCPSQMPPGQRCGAHTHKGVWIFLDWHKFLSKGSSLEVTPNGYILIYNTIDPMYLTILDTRRQQVIGDHQGPTTMAILNMLRADVPNQALPKQFTPRKNRFSHLPRMSEQRTGQDSISESVSQRASSSWEPPAINRSRQPQQQPTDNGNPLLRDILTTLAPVYGTPEPVHLEQAGLELNPVRTAPPEQVLSQFNCRVETVLTVDSSTERIELEPVSEFDHDNRLNWTTLSDIVRAETHPVVLNWNLDVSKHSQDIPCVPNSPLAQELRERFFNMATLPWAKIMSYILNQQERITEQESVYSQPQITVDFYWNETNRIFQFNDSSDHARMPATTAAWESLGLPIRNIKNLAYYLSLWLEEDPRAKEIFLEWTVSILRANQPLGAWKGDYGLTAVAMATGNLRLRSQYIAVGNQFYKWLYIQCLPAIMGITGTPAQWYRASDKACGDRFENLFLRAVETKRFVYTEGISTVAWFYLHKIKSEPQYLNGTDNFYGPTKADLKEINNSSAPAPNTNRFPFFYGTPDEEEATTSLTPTIPIDLVVIGSPTDAYQSIQTRIERRNAEEDNVLEDFLSNLAPTEYLDQQSATRQTSFLRELWTIEEEPCEDYADEWEPINPHDDFTGEEVISHLVDEYPFMREFLEGEGTAEEKEASLNRAKELVTSDFEWKHRAISRQGLTNSKARCLAAHARTLDFQKTVNDTKRKYHIEDWVEFLQSAAKMTSMCKQSLQVTGMSGDCFTTHEEAVKLAEFLTSGHTAQIILMTNFTLHMSLENDDWNDFLVRLRQGRGLIKIHYHATHAIFLRLADDDMLEKTEIKVNTNEIPYFAGETLSLCCFEVLLPYMKEDIVPGDSSKTYRTKTELFNGQYNEEQRKEFTRIEFNGQSVLALATICDLTRRVTPELIGNSDDFSWEQKINDIVDNITIPEASIIADLIMQRQIDMVYVQADYLLTLSPSKVASDPGDITESILAEMLNKKLHTWSDDLGFLDRGGYVAVPLVIEDYMLYEDGKEVAGRRRIQEKLASAANTWGPNETAVLLIFSWCKSRASILDRQKTINATRGENKDGPMYMDPRDIKINAPELGIYKTIPTRKFYSERREKEATAEECWTDELWQAAFDIFSKDILLPGLTLPEFPEHAMANEQIRLEEEQNTDCVIIRHSYTPSDFRVKPIAAVMQIEAHEVLKSTDNKHEQVWVPPIGAFITPHCYKSKRRRTAKGNLKHATRRHQHNIEKRRKEEEKAHKEETAVLYDEGAVLFDSLLRIWSRQIENRGRTEQDQQDHYTSSRNWHSHNYQQDHYASSRNWHSQPWHDIRDYPKRQRYGQSTPSQWQSHGWHSSQYGTGWSETFW